MKPVLGDRADALWLDYQLSPESRSEIEGLMRALANEYLGLNFEDELTLLAPPPPETVKGEYNLGRISYPGVVGMFGLREREWNQHVAIFGRTGSGKTNVGFLIARELLAHQKPILVFDWKRNYRDLLALPWAQDLRLLTVGRDVAPFYFNPLAPPPGTSHEVWLKKLIEIICHVYWLGEGVAYLLQKALDAVYRQHADTWPTMRDLLDWLVNHQTKGREAQWMESTLRAIATLCYGKTGEVLNSRSPDPIELLLKQSVVLELDALTNSDKTFLIESLLLWIHHFRLQEPERETFKHAIMIEEAHHVLLRPSESRESVMDIIVREIRELGESLVIIDQHPSLISIPALGNTNCTIGMNLKHARDVTAMGHALLLSEDQKDFQGRLPVGQGIVKIQSRWPKPFLVDFPLLEVKKAAISDNDLRKFRGDPAAPPVIRPPAAQEPDIQVIQPSDKRVEQTQIGEDELALVMDVARFPISGVAARYLRLGFSSTRGARLLKSPVFSTAMVPTPNGRVRFVRLTEKGREIAKANGALLPPARGNEGPEHEYWKLWVAEHYRSLGYSVEVEKTLPNGHVVDVWAEKDDERIGVEVDRRSLNPCSGCIEAGLSARTVKRLAELAEG